MPPRKSQHSLAKLGKRGKAPFEPDLKEWTEVCKLYPYDKDIFKHFDICGETFYCFLDNQRYLKEQGKKSDYLDAYKNGRAQSKNFALTTLLNAAKSGDSACTIFTAKTFGGLLEARDISHINLKKKEIEMKQKLHNLNVDEFLLKISERFNLKDEDKEELKRMAKEFKINVDFDVDIPR